jgi:uncharacterized damage-inducible protein DinB
MKDYFIRLFNYDKYANELIYQSIVEAGAAPQAVRLMAHLLAAQQIWLKRCQRLASHNGSLWPDWQADRFPALIRSNHEQWIEFISQLSDEAFSTSVSYRNSKGDEFENKLIDILAHLINHGTHHRAQAGQQLKFAGVEKLPVTDYIFYLREHK